MCLPAIRRLFSGPGFYPGYPPVCIFRHRPDTPSQPVLAAGLAFGAGIAVTNSLWGGFDWSSHNVNVNVNRYNNINVNNRLNSTDSTTSWNRNASVHANAANLNSVQHNAYRGYDNSHAQAMQTLQSRTGENMSGSASQRLQGIDKGGNNTSDLRNSADYANRGTMRCAAPVR